MTCTPGPWNYEIVPFDKEERSRPKSEWSGLYIGPSDDETGGVSHTIIEGAFTHGPEDGDPEDDARLLAAAPAAADLARHLAGMDDSFLLCADLNVIRQALRDWRDQARAVCDQIDARAADMENFDGTAR